MREDCDKVTRIKGNTSELHAGAVAKCTRVAPLTLFDHANNMPKLLATMARVGTRMSPGEFVRTVSNAYYAAHADQHATAMHAFFRRSGFMDRFQEALVRARKDLDKPIAVLNIGCGAGYELEVLQQVFSRADIRRILCSDISPQMLARARQKANGYKCQFLLADAEGAVAYGPYDLVVTHAMVHHIADLSSFFAVVDRAVAPGGAYVMGSEPNARYWVNEECMEVLEKKNLAERRRLQRAKYLNPVRYARKAARLVGLRGLVGGATVWERVNRMLRRQHGFVADLSPAEIGGLVDVHVPGSGGRFNIGAKGFDLVEIQKTYFQNFELVWVGTTGYMGASCSATDLPGRWQRLDAVLAAKYPMDGSNLCAYWRKWRRDR